MIISLVDEIIRHVFGTLTFTRNEQIQTTWKKASKAYNRFVQKWRRVSNQKIQYIRSIESHKDGYPHIHTIIQYPFACIRIKNSYYFDRRIYQIWKSHWEHGFSDYKKPTKLESRTLSYLMKYMTKTTTRKTIYKKILPKQTSTQKEQDPPQKTLTTKINGVKICTWSRNFDWKPFMIANAKDDDVQTLD